MKASRFIFPLIAILILVESPSCFSQTNFGVSLGVDFAEIRAVPNQVGFEILETGYGSKSLFGGLRIEQQVSTSIFLSLQGTYTKKKIDATDRGFVPFDWLEFRKIDVAFAVNWIPVSTLSIGGGISHGFIPSVNKVLRGGTKDEITRGRREIGGIFYASYLYREFLLEASYYAGFKVLNPSNESNTLESMNSIGISLSYIIRVFENRKGKKSSHPRI